jgi:hypothetical protein
VSGENQTKQNEKYSTEIITASLHLLSTALLYIASYGHAKTSI